eukprot:986165-Rhodomonas_salina.1
MDLGILLLDFHLHVRPLPVATPAPYAMSLAHFSFFSASVTAVFVRQQLKTALVHTKKKSDKNESAHLFAFFPLRFDPHFGICEQGRGRVPGEDDIAAFGSPE